MATYITCRVCGKRHDTSKHSEAVTTEVIGQAVWDALSQRDGQRITANNKKTIAFEIAKALAEADLVPREQCGDLMEESDRLVPPAPKRHIIRAYGVKRTMRPPRTLD